jgi:hypothetical protein
MEESQKLKKNIDLPYDPVIQFLVWTQKNMRDSCIPMFITELFIIAKLWNQPRYLSMNEWMKKMWYVYTMEFYSAMKKNEIMSFSGKLMEPEIIMLSDIRHFHRDKYHMCSLICRS